MSRLPTVTVAFDVSGPSLTLFPVLRKPRVVLAVKRRQRDPCIVLKSNKKSVLEFIYAVSAILLLPVWPKMAVDGLFSPVMRVLCCVVDSRLTRSAMECQLTTGIPLPVQWEVNIRRCRSPTVLFCHPEAFGLLTCEFRGQYFGETGSGSLRPR